MLRCQTDSMVLKPLNNNASHCLSSVNMDLLLSRLILPTETIQLQVKLREFQLVHGFCNWNTEWRLGFHDNTACFCQVINYVTDPTQIYLKGSTAASSKLVVKHIRNSINCAILFYVVGSIWIGPQVREMKSTSNSMIQKQLELVHVVINAHLLIRITYFRFLRWAITNYR